MLYTKVLPDHSLALLRAISPVLTEAGFYLAGGTALALRLGHRISVDLDFFSQQPFDPPSLCDLLEKTAGSPPQIFQQTPGSICMTLNQTKVELLHYPYNPLEEVESIDGITLASLADNVAIKLSAMANRGSKKDFIDIDALLKTHQLKELLDHHSTKFPNTDVFTIIKSLTWFDDAEAEPDPNLLKQKTWEDVKKAITKSVAKLVMPP